MPRRVLAGGSFSASLPGGSVYLQPCCPVLSFSSCCPRGGGTQEGALGGRGVGGCLSSATGGCALACRSSALPALPDRGMNMNMLTVLGKTWLLFNIR